RELVEALAHVQVIGVMDRSISFGAMNNAGPLFLELCAALKVYGGDMPIVDYVFGLGGRDIVPSQIEQVARDLLKIAETGERGEPVRYLGVRE
ncbi:MAG TPA: pyruvate ferredoxin oxidoreductase, partial [Anaerolineae bacterium]|nr:pyruvate ferredoxin oxidoreductase [Anaerolineae bacterium]